jgi:ribosome-binding ATPase YchF (GTP1/OBG family)
MLTSILKSFHFNQDPIRDMETIMYELCRKDATYVAASIAKQEAEIKRDPKKKFPPAYYAMMDKVQEM